MNKTYKYVSYLWDDEKANQLNDEVELFIYRSNLLGADLRLTNYGGGNTSCRTIEKDPLTGKDAEVMWIKGSGGDLGTLKHSGLAALYLERLRDMNRSGAVFKTFGSDYLGRVRSCLVFHGQTQGIATG